MKKFLFILFLFQCMLFSTHTCVAQNADSIVLKKIYNEELLNGKAYSWLYDLTTNIGGRLSGSPEAARAVEFAKNSM